MAATAQMSPNWAWRMVLVTTVFAGFALWCLYDALAGYPRFNRRAAEYNRLLATGRADEWPAVAAESGWSPRFPEDDIQADGTIAPKTDWDLGTQYVMLAGALAVAVPVLVRLLRARRRTMRADDEGFRTIEGSLVPYADITDIDLRQWQRKSIARVQFRHARGKAWTVIDDWIYRGGEDVLAEIQRRTGLGPAGPETPGEPQQAEPAPAEHASPVDRGQRSNG
jgi:hypothetical protein